MSKKKQEKKVKESLFLNYAPIVISALSLLVSAFAIAVSVPLAKTQEYYLEKDYEYQREPAFILSMDGFSLKLEYIDGERVAKPVINGYEIEIAAINNLDRMYMISPNFKVTEIPSRNAEEDTADEDLLEEGIDNYFKQAYANGAPDLKIGENWYYYHFFVFKQLDGTYNMQALFTKSSPLHGAEPAPLSFKLITDIDLLEFEKSHLDDENYEGERIIAKQFREILENIRK